MLEQPVILAFNLFGGFKTVSSVKDRCNFISLERYVPEQNSLCVLASSLAPAEITAAFVQKYLIQRFMVFGMRRKSESVCQHLT